MSCNDDINPTGRYHKNQNLDTVVDVEESPLYKKASKTKKRSNVDEKNMWAKYWKCDHVL
jgi:hypothetical protein